jgi:hypothetical protein
LCVRACVYVCVCVCVCVWSRHPMNLYRCMDKWDCLGFAMSLLMYVHSPRLIPLTSSSLSTHVGVHTHTHTTAPHHVSCTCAGRCCCPRSRLSLRSDGTISCKCVGCRQTGTHLCEVQLNDSNTVKARPCVGCRQTGSQSSEGPLDDFYPAIF